jgi:hypothetical protein
MAPSYQQWRENSELRAAERTFISHANPDLWNVNHAFHTQMQTFRSAGGTLQLNACHAKGVEWLSDFESLVRNPD